MRGFSAYGQFGMTRLIQSLIKDHEAIRLSMNVIMASGCDRIVVSHGSITEKGSKAISKKTFYIVLEWRKLL